MNREKLFFRLTVFAAAGVLTAAFFDYNGFDFHVYYAAGQSLLGGRTDLYAADFASSALLDYRYPPFFLFVFLPLWLLPVAAAAIVWSILNAGSFFAGLFFIRKQLRRILPECQYFNLVAFICLLAVVKFLIPSLRLGNAHLLTVGLVFVAFCLWRVKREFPAATLLAAAICFKIFPVLSLPYFFIRRQWRFLILTIVLLAAFNFAPAAWFGLSKNADLIGEWTRHVVTDSKFHDLNGPINLSLKGQLTRLLTNVDYSQRVADRDYPPVNFLSLPDETVNLIWIVGAGLIFGSTLLSIWLKNSGKQKITNAEISDKNVCPNDFFIFHEFALLVCLMLLIAPRTNDIYLVAMIFPLFILGIYSFQKKFLAARICFGLVIFITMFLPLVPGSHAARWLKVFGADFYAVLILWLGLLIIYLQYIKSGVSAIFSKKTRE